VRHDHHSGGDEAYSNQLLIEGRILLVILKRVTEDTICAIELVDLVDQIIVVKVTVAHLNLHQDTYS
jgi:hypothetical protein